MTDESYYELQDVDEVARMREIRRELEAAHPTAEEFDKWLTRLQKQHDRRQKDRGKPRSAASH